jgi:hypothetical protein
MTIAWGGERGAGGSGAVLGGEEGGVIPLTIANHEPSDAEIAEIEARKAELQEQKERERRRGGRVLSEKFIRRDQPGNQRPQPRLLDRRSESSSVPLGRSGTPGGKTRTPLFVSPLSIPMRVSPV